MGCIRYTIRTKGEVNAVRVCSADLPYLVCRKEILVWDLEGYRGVFVRVGFEDFKLCPELHLFSTRNFSIANDVFKMVRKSRDACGVNIFFILVYKEFF